MVRKLLLIFLFVAYATLGFAASADTVSVYSRGMNKNIKTVILLPEVYKSSKNFPVVYLLHGYSDDYGTWIKNVPHIKDLADRYNLIIVMPDGDYNSWYWDSPVDDKSRYETFISRELIRYIDKNYKTIKNRKGRAITGNRMGGQGALFITFRHQDIFGAAGSLSGGLDIRPFHDEWEMADKLGPYTGNKKRWDEYAVVNQIERLDPGRIDLIIDCGTEDFFYEVNLVFHRKLLQRKIPHVFIQRPGVHDWSCWKEAIDYQLLFFNSFFKN
jgi:S-formylglutathione hydrolase FrmB